MFDATVVAQSRAFVCLRLASYESAVEYAFLEQLYGREGEVPNTVFGILAPDGKTRLTRFGRGPSALVGRGRRGARGSGLADVLARYAARYEPRAAIRALPQNLDFRRALNVAACDAQPLVVVLAEDAETRQRAAARLAPLCWSKAFVGRMQYALVASRDELRALEGVPAKDAVLLVRPGEFGLDGRVVAHCPVDAKAAELERLLAKAPLAQSVKLDTRAHVRRGERAGAEWRTAVPVTDRRAQQAEERRRARRRRR